MALKKLKREETFASQIAVNKGTGLSSMATAERNRAARLTSFAEDFARDTLQEIKRQQETTARDLASTYIPNPKSTDVEYEFDGGVYRTTINTFDKPELPDAINTRTGADLYRRLATEKYNRRLLQEVQFITDREKKTAIANMIDGANYQNNVAIAMQPFMDTLDGAEKELALSYAKTYLDSSSVDVELSYDANQRAMNFTTLQQTVTKDLPILLNKAINSEISDEEFLLDYNTLFNFTKAYEGIIPPTNEPQYKQIVEQIEGAKVYRNLFLDIPLQVDSKINYTDAYAIQLMQSSVANLQALERLSRADTPSISETFMNKLGEEKVITREQLLSAFGYDATRLNKLSTNVSQFVTDGLAIGEEVNKSLTNYKSGINIGYGADYSGYNDSVRNDPATMLGMWDSVKSKFGLADDDTFTFESLNNIDVRTQAGRDVVESIIANPKKRAVINEVLRLSDYNLMPNIFRDAYNAVVLDPNNTNAQDLVISIFRPENGIVFGGGFDPQDDRNLYYLTLALDGVLDSTIGVTVNQGHEAVHRNRLERYLGYVQRLDEEVTPASIEMANNVITATIRDRDGLVDLIETVIDDPIFYESLQKAAPNVFKAINFIDSELADEIGVPEKILGGSLPQVGYSENINTGAVNAREEFRAIIDNSDTAILDAMSFRNIENQLRFILPAIKTEKEMTDVTNKVILEEFKRGRFGVSSIASPYKFEIGINQDKKDSLNLVSRPPESIFTNNIELINFNKFVFKQIEDNPVTAQMIANVKDLDYRSIGSEFKLYQTDYSTSVYTIRPFDSEFGYQTDLVGDDGNVIRINLDQQLIDAIRRATYTDLSKE